MRSGQGSRVTEEVREREIAGRHIKNAPILDIFGP